MTLEDFFTLTEMRDGLTAPARVQDLVFIMEKEKDCVTKSSGDAIRQWAAVASSISATESRECMDLFLQLDGLSFMNRWLMRAEKASDDAQDGFIEESISGLLNAIDKLQLDSERSVSSGLWTTVENLLGHRSRKVQEKAQALFDSWKPREMDISEGNNDGKAEPCDNPYGEGKLDGIMGQVPSPKGCPVDPATTGIKQVTDSSEAPPEKVEDEMVLVIADKNILIENLSQEGAEDKSPSPLLSSHQSSLVNKIGQDEDKVAGEVSARGGFTFNMEMQQSGDGVAGVLEAVNSDEAVQRADKVENPQITTGHAENSSSKSSDSHFRSLLAETDAPVSSLRLCGVSTTAHDVSDERPGSATTGGKDEKVMEGTCHSAAKEAQHASRSSTSALNVHERELNQRKIDDSRIFFSKVKYGGTGDNVEGHSHRRNEGTDTSVSYRLDKGTRGRSLVDKKGPNADLDYGMIDALEVARQVAQEVEREVVDRKERFCSSPSERDSGGGPGQAGSPESVREGNPSSDSLSDRLPRQNSSSEDSFDGDRSVSEKQNAEPENSVHDMESSQVTEATQDPEDKTQRDFCAFDLNEEVSSDNMDKAEITISAPISALSPSKPAASSGVPSAPLQFEGILGWKGSAATSAFRAASPRSSVGDKTGNAERLDGGQKLSSLKIDLNIAETGDDKFGDLMLTMPIPVSSSLRSGESSVEVSSRRPEKPGLDLNRLGDDGEPSISNLRRGHPGFYHLNSRRSPSPSSSSSSMHPSTRNFDLNDRPLTYPGFTEHGPRGTRTPQKVSSSRKPTQEPVISIFGAKVEVNKKDHFPQTLSLPNGYRGFETAFDAASITAAGGRFSGMGPGNPYQHEHPHMWAFNGLTAGPTVSLAPAVYCPGSSIPYVLDPRSVPAVPFSYPQAPAPPFMMSMAPGPFTLNGPYPAPGPMRPHLDLNPGFSMSDGVNRESTAALRQFFVPDHVPDHARPAEEHIRAGLPPTSSGTKRKEPEGGWEPFPLTFRQQQPPWK